jgi:threonine synthase
VIWCPHTATAAEAWAQLDADRRHARRWVIVATAHPAKFREIVEPLVGRPVPVPESLERLFRLPAQFREIEANLGALRAAMVA